MAAARKKKFSAKAARRFEGQGLRAEKKHEEGM
jgi:hypothetical protein